MTKRPVANVPASVFARLNTTENARLTFESVVTDQLQDLANTNFEFYKRVTDDDAFARHFLNWLFDRVKQNVRG